MQCHVYQILITGRLVTTWRIENDNIVLTKASLVGGQAHLVVAACCPSESSAESSSRKCTNSRLQASTSVVKSYYGRYARFQSSY